MLNIYFYEIMVLLSGDLINSLNLFINEIVRRKEWNQIVTLNASARNFEIFVKVKR